MPFGNHMISRYGGKYKPDKVVVTVVDGWTGHFGGEGKTFRVAQFKNNKQLKDNRQICETEIRDNRCEMTGMTVKTLSKLNEYILDNKFKLEIVGSGDGRYSKTGYIPCNITQGEIEIPMDFRSENIESLIRYTTVVKGKVRKEVELVWINGEISPTIKGTVGYKSAEFDTKYKNKYEKNKTSKFKAGSVYSGLESDKMYLGELYQWIEDYDNVDEYVVELLDKPKVKHLELDGEYRWNKEGFSIGQELDKMWESTLKNYNFSGSYTAMSILTTLEQILSQYTIKNTKYPKVFKKTMENERNTQEAVRKYVERRDKFIRSSIDSGELGESNNKNRFGREKIGMILISTVKDGTNPYLRLNENDWKALSAIVNLPNRPFKVVYGDKVIYERQVELAVEQG